MTKPLSDQSQSPHDQLTVSWLRTVAKRIASRALFDYAYGRTQPDTHHAFLSRVFPTAYAYRHAFGGLETSLGIKLWEQLALEIVVARSATVLDKKTVVQMPANNLPAEVESAVASLARNRLASKQTLAEIGQRLEPVCQKYASTISQWRPLEKGSGVDLAFESNGNTYLYDIKTVQLNAGGGFKYSNTLVLWMACWLLAGNSARTVNCHIAIPYNPYLTADWWARQSGRAAPLDARDVQVQEDFWSRISGVEGAFEAILAGFSDTVTTEFTEVHTNALLNPGLDSDLALIEYHQGWRAKVPAVSLGKRGKPLWECTRCGISGRYSWRHVAQNVCGNCSTE